MVRKNKFKAYDGINVTGWKYLRYFITIELNVREPFLPQYIHRDYALYVNLYWTSKSVMSTVYDNNAQWHGNIILSEKYPRLPANFSLPNSWRQVSIMFERFCRVRKQICRSSVKFSQKFCIIIVGFSHKLLKSRTVTKFGDRCIFYANLHLL